jgi:predicted ATPase/transcriptional regulator with XRE-family HTH domain
MDRTHSFGYWLRRRRKALDLTQAGLAQQVSCSLDLIQKIEADARRPSRQLAEKLADRLGLDAVERVAFVQAARAERAVNQLALPSHPVEQPQRSSGTNLPAQLTMLIGRESEVASVCALLRRADIRLLTLTGPGGIGKTRLGLQVAADLVEDFTDGVYFVDLAPIRDPNLVVGALAQTLMVRESGSQPLLERLKDKLREKQMLLLLDNFEQVPDAATLVVELLATAAELKVLVTSREHLHLRGEQEIAVQPLALPDSGQLPPVERLSQYSAIAMFIQHARALQPAFQLTNANVLAVAEICVRLDGLPLAIELAAARLKLFSPEMLLARLGSRLALLTGGPRDLPARQQALRTTIDWSYNLLTPAEQRLFRQLAVFVGGWTLDAAEGVLRTAGCGLSDATATSARSPQSAVLNGLAALVDHSLIRQALDLDGTLHFRRLETIGEYAQELLLADPEEPILRRKHAQYYTQLAEQAAEKVYEQTSRIWLNRLASAYDNLQVALSWSVTTPGQTLAALQLTAGLHHFWTNRGLTREGLRWAKRALALPWDGQAPELRAAALNGAGRQESWVGAVEVAEQFYMEALQIYEQLDDQRGCSDVLCNLGFLHGNRRSLARAQVFQQASLRAAQAAGSREGTARAMHGLSWVLATQGYLAEAQPLADACVAIWEVLHNPDGRGNFLHLQGYIQWHTGDITAATATLIECQRVFEDELGSATNVGALQMLAAIARDQGRYAEAERLLHRCMVGERDNNTSSGFSVTHWSLCFLALARGDGEVVRAYLYERRPLLRALDRESCREVERLVAGALALETAQFASAGEHYRAYMAYWSRTPEQQSASPQRMVVTALALTGLATARAQESQAQGRLAARLWGAADAAYHSQLPIAFGTTLVSIPRLNPAVIQRAQASARAQLGDGAFQAVWAEGQALTLEQAVDEALGEHAGLTHV